MGRGAARRGAAGCHGAPASGGDLWPVSRRTRDGQECPASPATHSGLSPLPSSLPPLPSPPHALHLPSPLNPTSTRKGNTALHEAVLLGPDGQEAIETLLEEGANAKAKNAKGETAYDLAVRNGYDSIAALFASSMGQDMLDKMADAKTGAKAKAKAAKAKKKAKEEAEEESEEEFVVKKRKAYKEKLPKVR